MNTNRRIFGGFLVRKAFELAFTTAYLFAKTVPRFIEIDSVEFRQPVDVGDLVHFTSKVLFCSEELHDQPSVHVEVVAYVVTPDTKKTAASMVCEVSNTFNFSYLVPKGTLLPTVYPASKEEALAIVTRYAADVAQKQEDLDNTAAPA
jgi:acyl-coenzyme A thioesterase 9